MKFNLPKIQKSLLYFLGGFFVLIILISFTFYYFENYQDNLAKFTPYDSLLYLNINNNKIENQKHFDFLQDQLKNKFNLKENQKNHLLSLIDNKIALIILPGENKNQFIIISKTRNKKGVDNFISHTELKHKYLNKNYFALSNLSLKNFNYQKSILDKRLFASKLSRLKWYDAYGLINYNQPILLTINSKNNKSLFNITYYQNNPLFKFTLENSEKINKNFKISLNTNNFKNDFKSWQNEFKNFEPKLALKMEKKEKSWQENFDFDLQKDILSILNYPGRFVISDLKENQIKWYPQRETHLIIKNKNEKLPLKKIEELVKTALAYEIPKKDEKILPDGSKITEMIARPENFQFQDTNFQNTTFRQLKEEDSGFEFSYGIIENQLIFSNSLNSLQNIPKIDDSNYILIKPTDNLADYFKQITAKMGKNKINGSIY